MKATDADDRRFEQARALAEQALDLLIKTRIPPTPPNYAVSFVYFEGMVREIYDVINERLREGHLLDEDLLLALYERYVLPHGYERFRNVRIDLERLLKNLLIALRSADEGNSEFIRALEANIQALDTAREAQAVQIIANALLKAANQAQSQNQTLAKELQLAREELKHAQTELEKHRRAALIDPLTGLYNRRAFEEIIAELWQDEQPLTLLVIDIDHFKKINDTYGHQVGDVVIREVASVLRRGIRGEDYAVRYGGEEFIVLLPDTDLAGGMRVAENLRTRVARLRLVRKHDNLAIGAFTISAGVAMRQPGDTPERLFKRADEALYISKTSGRNRVTSKI